MPQQTGDWFDQQGAGLPKPRSTPNPRAGTGDWFDQSGAVGDQGIPDAPTGNFGGQFLTTPPTMMDRFRENLPMIGGAVAGTGLALTSPGWVIPAVGAGIVAGAATGVKNLWRAAQGLDVPQGVGENVADVVKGGVAEGVLPELTGQLTGFAGRKVGNTVMRPFAEKRNARVLDKITNPNKIKVSESGAEYGQPFQTNANTRYTTAQAPLTQEYDRILKGPVGQATDLIRVKGGKYGKGPTIAEMHQDRSDLLRSGRTQLEAGANIMPRSRMAAKHEAQLVLQRMEKAAKRHGLTLDDYKNVSDAWRGVEDQFANKAVRTVREGMSGSDVVRHLSNPRLWKTFKQGTTRTPVDKAGVLQALKGAVDPATWANTQAAIAKNILFEVSKGSKQINGVALRGRLDEIRKYLGPNAKELVPSIDKLEEVAEIFKKSYGTPDAPNLISRKVSMLQWALKHTNMETPDLKRLLAENAGERDIVEHVVEVLTRTGIVAGTMSERPSSHEIPEPPNGQRPRTTP